MACALVERGVATINFILQKCICTLFIFKFLKTIADMKATCPIARPYNPQTVSPHTFSGRDNSN
jgi:hypothetical protein